MSGSPDRIVNQILEMQPAPSISPTTTFPPGGMVTKSWFPPVLS